jgi:hypothetical protein
MLTLAVRVAMRKDAAMRPTLSAMVLPVFALFASAAAPPALPRPLSTDEAARTRCVAALAIVANDQARGAEGWTDFPPLDRRGAHFAGVVGEALMKDWTRTREQVRDIMIADVHALQKQYANAPDRQAWIEQVARTCITMMNQIDPAPPPPTLPQCAAIMSLAARDAGKDSADTDKTRLLATLASALDYRARTAMIAEGKSGTERDRAMAEARDSIDAMVKAKSVPDDFVAACADMAKP